MNGIRLDPPLDYRDYRSTARRAPLRPPVPLAAGIEGTGPVFGAVTPGPHDHDLTQATGDAPIGQRIIVTGRVLDAGGRPVGGALVEVWQANAAGRYHHPVDETPAPLDPNFEGAGRCLTEADGSYRFVTIRPGAYPWLNHHNAWRPAHIHFSVFGRSFLDRLVTQMYFPGDPLLDHDPIYQSVPAAGRGLLVSAFDLDATVPSWALGYRWDIVLGGSRATPPDGARR